MIQSSYHYYCKTNLYEIYTRSVVCRLFHPISYTLHWPTLFSINYSKKFPRQPIFCLCSWEEVTTHYHRLLAQHRVITALSISSMSTVLRLGRSRVERWTHCDGWPIPEVCSVLSSRRYPSNSGLSPSTPSTLFTSVRSVRFGPRGQR